MHIYRPGTDQNLELTLLINGIPATEYELPDASSTILSDGYLDTYIAVKPSDRLALKWTWSGSVLHGQFDWVADGTLVRENRIEGDSQTGAVRYVKKTQKFDTALDCPTPEGWTSSEPSKDVFEGNLVVADLDVESLNEIAGGDRPGVGSLVFVASVNQYTLDNYHDPEKSLEMGNWKLRAEDEVRPAEIPPEFALELKLSSDDKIKAKRSVQHRTRWVQTRFGRKAWGKMCFYYRSRAAIERMGGVVRDDTRVLEVDAWDDEREFVEVEPVKRAAPKRKGGAASEDDDGDESLFMSTKDTPERKIKQEDVSDRATTPRPKKKARLGGALFGSAEKVSRQNDDATIITETNEAQYDELFGSQDDVEPISSELAAAPDEDPFQSASNESANKLDYFGRQAEQESTSALFDDAALPPPDWKFPSSPPPCQQKLGEVSPLSPPADTGVDPFRNSRTLSHTSPTSLTATPAAANMNTTNMSADTPNFDHLQLPTTVEIENEIDPTGTPRDQILQLLLINGPFDDQAALEAIYIERVETLAVLRSDGKYYLKGEKNVASTDEANTIVAKSRGKAKNFSPVPRAAAKKTNSALKVAANKSSPAAKPTQATRTKTKTKPAASPAAIRGGVKDNIKPDTKQDLSSHHSTPQQAPPAAAPKSKFQQPAIPATPAADHKRLRTASSTPSTMGGSLNRKERMAILRRELAAKQARLKKGSEKVKREDEEIARLVRLNAEADQKLVDMGVDEVDEDEDDDMMEEDAEEDAEENDMDED